MSPKAEYWNLSQEEFREIKSQINHLGEMLLEGLKGEGFTKIKSQNDWLGLTVEKRTENILTFVGLSLTKEAPKEFELMLRSWDINRPSETFIEYYCKEFNSLDDISESLDNELDIIRKKLIQ